MNQTAPLPFRLLTDQICDPFLHFAVEETLLRRLDEGTSPPTLRLRTVIPSVFIGVYQFPEEDVDVAYCQNHQIPIVRRPNPGGAVYQDEGSFCYSLFFPRESCFQHWGITEPGQLYGLVGEAVKECCADFGVVAEISPVNDVTIGGRKVYGSAQVLWYNAFVHSGSFLVNTNINTMQQVLKPSFLKFADKGFINVRDRVINLVEAAQRDISPAVVKHRLAFFLAKHLDLTLEPGALTPAELDAAQELYKIKYAQPQWTYRNKPEYTHMVSTKAQSGVIGLSVAVQGDRITQMAIKGDFLMADQQKLADLMEGCRGKLLGELPNSFQDAFLPADVREALIKLGKELKESVHGYH